MKKRLSHTAVPSRLTQGWHVLKPLIPSSYRYQIRKNLQYIHSRALTVDDVLLLSYPKSGSTWLRSMLLLVISRNTATSSQLAEWIPPLHMVTHKKLSKPRIVRSHDAINTPGFSRSGKILVLVRDPRALVVSYYHHTMRRGLHSSVEDCTDKLLTHGFDNLGSWKNHIKCALKQEKLSDNVKIVTYEAMLENTHQELTDILTFYGIDHSTNNLEEIIDKCNPNNLRKMRINAGVDSSSPNGSDVRAADSQGWQLECPQNCIERIQNATHQELKTIGYKLA